MSDVKKFNLRFLQMTLSAAMKYRSSALKIGLSSNDSDDKWGVNVWRNYVGALQFSPASYFDGPDVDEEFISISELRNELSYRGELKSFDNHGKKKYNQRNVRKKNGKIRMDDRRTLRNV